MGSRMLSRILQVLLPACVLVWAAGCRVHPSTAGEDGAAGAASSTGASAGARKPGTARIPDEVLRPHGLESLWYNPPRDAKHERGVHSVELLGEGLFIAALPREGQKGLLKMVLRSNGHTRWYCDLSEPLRFPPAAYEYPPRPDARQGEVYFSQLDTVHCVDLRYGDTLWTQKLEFPVSTRIDADDVGFFVGSLNGRAYGLKKNTRVEDWTYRTGDAIQGAPLVDGGNVYVASTDGVVYRLSTRGGFVPGSSWKLPTGSRIVADPTSFSRWVIAGSTDYKLYCLEKNGGAVFWAFQCEAPVEEPPVVYSFRPNQEHVYCVAVDRAGRKEKRTLFSVKLSTGEETWRAAGVRKVVSLGKSNLYVLNDPAPGEPRSLIALDALSGKEKYHIPVEGFGFVPTNSADQGRNAKERGRIYLVAEDGTIQVLGERL
ncbi:MAG: PQQ-like beta-propeller repeat protein [Planctomycetes bacterium]|nr:PQQ-like beta-propeller repeat protein [Planctomycetota bacterium]